jgi:transcriptional regulator with XRE-family HTH domain
MTISELIRRIRKERGETGTAFGRHLGVGHPIISAYEHGKFAPSVTVLLALYRLVIGTVYESDIQALLPYPINMQSGPSLALNEVLAREVREFAAECLRFHQRATELLARLEKNGDVKHATADLPSTPEAWRDLFEDEWRIAGQAEPSE